MMHLLDLPDELLEVCCATGDPKALRLTCRRLTPLATKQLFAHAILQASAESANKLRAILRDEHLAPLVTSLEIRTTMDEYDSNDLLPRWEIETAYELEFDEDEQAAEDEYGSESCNEYYQELSAVFKSTLYRVGSIQNLRHVTLQYHDRVCSLLFLRTCALVIRHARLRNDEADISTWETDT